jgi:hypothetical protein
MVTTHGSMGRSVKNIGENVHENENEKYFASYYYKDDPVSYFGKKTVGLEKPVKCDF